MEVLDLTCIIISNWVASLQLGFLTPLDSLNVSISGFAWYAMNTAKGNKGNLFLTLWQWIIEKNLWQILIDFKF